MAQLASPLKADMTFCSGGGRRRTLWIAAMAAAVLAGCAPMPTQPPAPVQGKASDAPAVAETWTPQAPKTELPATPPVAIVAPGVGTQSAHPGREAVASLATKARREQKAGEWDAAAATLERALRLDPRNADLWHQMAGVHLDQKHWRQAAEFASRSNALAVDDKDLQARNWRLIARAREMSGDPQGATHAYDQAARLERD